ncbi:MAG: sigma 54-interacting transcriptional regulator [bacterium]
MNHPQVNVLLIEDNPGDARLIWEKLIEAKASHWKMESVETLSEGLKLFEKGPFDIVLLDLGLPDSRGLDTFLRLYSRMSKVPIIVLTGLDDEAMAIKTVQEGAQDYLIKGRIDGNLLIRSILYAMERKRSETKLEEMLAQIEKSRDDLLSMMEKLRLGVVMTAPEGGITFLNNTAEKLLGKNGKDLMGLHWEDGLDLDSESIEFLHDTIAQPHELRKKTPAVRISEEGLQYHMEIDVEEDPRDPQRKIFFMYDVSEVHFLRKQLHDNAQFHNLIGKSKCMRLVYQQIEDISRVDSTALIEGDTGTGKELVARTIHSLSHRKDKPFIAVNCAGLTESLVASQLFGHRKGAFTGAFDDQKGLFEAADGGTLFLDEIGDIPLNIQTSLLRALQEKEILRIGESKPRLVDVRFLAATQHDLNVLVKNGDFRSDLFYRLRIARIQLPPLRERREDIPLLALAFLRQFRTINGKPIDRISDNAIEILMKYGWPGNVRELKSAIEFAVIHCRNSIIQPENLPPEIIESEAHPKRPRKCEVPELGSLTEALEKAGGNHALAARILGIGRSTLYRRIEKFGLDPEDRRSIKFKTPILKKHPF